LTHHLTPLCDWAIRSVTHLLINESIDLFNSPHTNTPSNWLTNSRVHSVG
jgi:hypothetical protein